MSDAHDSPSTFYLGREYDLAARRAMPDRPVHYSSRDLTTHAVIVGMTGSGKTGLCIDVLEEAALDGITAIVIDPKGDIANLLLQFPDLLPADFAPWIDQDAARRGETTTEALAAEEAERWRAGLAEWGVSPDRIRSLLTKAEFRVYTPGSDAGRAISVLHSLRAPDPAAWDDEAEALREMIAGTASALLGLIGVEADPVRSREHILLSNIFEHAWRKGRDLDLAQLILQINKPPFAKLGAFDVDTFFPERDRFALATALNGLIAAPGFRSWLEGEPLDVGTFLSAPRVNLFYIAHLSEQERMFFVTLLLEQVQAWMRKQPGTTNLRALLYFDEVYGYFPPYPSNPPSKSPLLRLLKEARAFGIGLLLVTQNPMDLDYKGLTNAGTWFIGKLQTDRDKARVLEGLEGVISAAGKAVRRDELDRLMAALETRVFLLHNVHGDGPRVFQTRWAMAYLRGPLTRSELRRLVPRPAPALPVSPASPAAPASPGAPAAASVGAAMGAAADGEHDSSPSPVPASDTAPPALPSEIHQFYLPVTLSAELAARRWTAAAATQHGAAPLRTLPAEVDDEAVLHYVPALLAQGLVRFFDRKAGINEEQVAACLVRAVDPRGLIRWEDGHVTPIDPEVLGHTPFAHATFDTLPAPLANPKKMAAMEKDFAGYLYRSMALSLWYNPALKVYSVPSQSERDFRAACEEQARQMRDVETSKLQVKVQSRVDGLRTKLAGEERRRDALQAEVESRKSEENWTNLESVWDAITKRRIRRPVSTAQRAKRFTEQSALDLEDSLAKIAELTQQIAEIDARVNGEWQAVTDKWVQAAQLTQPLQVTPRKSDIRVELFGIGWVPFWRVLAGGEVMDLPAGEI